MTEPELTQRLAAILAADVAGYSRLMSGDERATVAALDAARAVFRHHIESSRGRVIDMAGDAVLAVFETAIGAVSAALAIQQQLAILCADVSDNRRMRFRIGVHLGDVIEKADGTVYGDGINVAARLEGMAEPGGIILSAAVYEQVQGRVPGIFADLGALALKNIARPVRAYRLVLAGAPAARPSNPTVDERPVLAVLPFTNLGGDPEQEYFADGITEDIITALSRVRWFLVIARNSSFTYKGRAVDVKQVGRELGVRYVLEGSVRRAGERLRITGQLVEVETGTHVWAERYDGTMAEVFDLQDRITEAVAAAIEPQLRHAEIERAQRKRPDNLSAYDRYLRALSHFYLASRDGMATTLRYLEETIRLDPDYAPPYVLAAQCYVYYVTQGWTDDAERDQAEGARLARAAVERDRDDPTVLWMAGHALGFHVSEWETSLGLLDRSLALNPSSAAAQCFAGWGRCYAGELERAVGHFEAALRLSPVDRTVFLFQSGLATALIMLGRDEEAVQWATRAIREQPKWTSSYRPLAAGLVGLGRMEEAKAAARRALEIQPNYRLSSLSARFRPSPERELYLDRLRNLGLPD